MPQVIAPGFKSLGRISYRHPFARGFRIRAIAQSGFGRDGMFMPPMSEVGVLKSVTLDQAASDKGDSYVLRYVIEQLPLSIPIKVEAAMSGVPWKGDVGGRSRAIGPSNWTGVITLKPGRPVALATQIGKIGGIGGALRARTGAAGARAPGTKEGIIIVSGREAATATGPQFGKQSRIVIPGKTTASAGEAVALNPQPLPPKPNPADPVMAKRAQSSVLAANKNPSFIARIAPPPGGWALNAPVTAMSTDAAAANKIDSYLALKAPIDNPTGTLSVADIDFEMGLITPPR